MMDIYENYTSISIKCSEMMRFTVLLSPSSFGTRRGEGKESAMSLAWSDGRRRNQIDMCNAATFSYGSDTSSTTPLTQEIGEHPKMKSFWKITRTRKKKDGADGEGWVSKEAKKLYEDVEALQIKLQLKSGVIMEPHARFLHQQGLERKRRTMQERNKRLMQGEKRMRQIRKLKIWKAKFSETPMEENTCMRGAELFQFSGSAFCAEHFQTIFSGEATSYAGFV
ncbi:hypothetical protein LguiB_013784 [Lonicera macranthoides]